MNGNPTVLGIQGWDPILQRQGVEVNTGVIFPPPNIPFEDVIWYFGNFLVRTIEELYKTSNFPPYIEWTGKIATALTMN